jgi:anthranilate synthase
MQVHQHTQYQCGSGLRVRRTSTLVEYVSAIDKLARSLNDHAGVLLASSFEYPGRYTRWDIGFVNPPLQISAWGRRMVIAALNKRGEVLLPEIFYSLQHCDVLEKLESDRTEIRLQVQQDECDIEEELRSRRPSVFSVLRSLVACFASSEDHYLGLYGAFGYDLTFQFEDVRRCQQRDSQQRDLVLYLPDQIIVADHRVEQALCYSYEFNCRRSGPVVSYTPAIRVEQSCDHSPGEYARRVEQALDYFRRGDLFEVVPGQSFFEPCTDSPADVFLRLKKNNPAPYGALMNLGQREYLVAASPEMFVRVDGDQIETCPISGTIKRGEDAIADARQIQILLNSCKDESELSMCTDVDRNDKARVCEPGSVEVVGRRQIEMYSRLIHTVDHVKGRLKQGFDALDGFLAHTWAVTVTGAPKLAAMQFIERHEKSPRLWYGGAIGQIGFDGNLNTGLTLRTVRIKDGVAEIRAGATLLVDSDPQAEEEETRLKASALIDAVRGEAPVRSDKGRQAYPSALGAGLTALMVDHHDSFVHNLAAYFRQCGVSIVTLRPEPARRYLRQQRPDLIILSPGPSRPENFGMNETIKLALAKAIPLFGVCLGLQGLVEYFGGDLQQLPYPMHGKPSQVLHNGSGLFAGIAGEFSAGRYHSLAAQRVPSCLQVTARTEAGVVMAVEHESMPISAVQFHPESIMTLENSAGQQLINNVVGSIRRRQTLQEGGAS